MASEDSGEMLKRMKATEFLRARCADFLPEELSISAIDNLLHSGSAGDFLLKTTDKYTKAFADSLEDPAAKADRKAALEAVFQAGDPLVIEDLYLRLALDSQNGKRGYFIDGKFHGLDSDVDVGWALYLLPCGMGLRCDMQEFVTTTRCAAGWKCDASRFEEVEQTLEAIPGAYEKVFAMYESMRDAALRADASFFLRP